MPLLPADGVFGDPAHVIQVALTPVFLLNVFNTRLSRVADHVEHVSELLGTLEDGAERDALVRQLDRLQRRTTVLDSSIVLGALGGVATCGAAFALFVVTARDWGAGWVLLALFGAALGFTIGALGAFVIDSLLAWHGLRRDGPLPRPGPTR